MNERAEQIEEEEIDQEKIDLAKSMGWVPEEEFRGDKSRWVDAETFVEKGMNDLPILRERLRAQSKTIADMRSDFDEFKTFHQNAVAREYNRALQEIEQKQLQTVEDGDTEEYKKLQAQKAALAKQRENESRQQGNPGEKLYNEWKQKHAEWFEKDDIMTAYAQVEGDKVASEHPEYLGKIEFLDEIERRVKSRFPDRFDNGNRYTPPAVEAGGAPRQSINRVRRSYDALPQEAKAACDKFVRQGLITREQYVNEYEWE